MGLKKDAPPEVTDEAGNAPEGTPTPTPTPAPTTPAPAKAKAAAKRARKTVELLAVHREISDPTTGVSYGKIHATPGVVSAGNWLDCQIKAGILVEK